jgi:hypothetical protein
LTPGGGDRVGAGTRGMFQRSMFHLLVGLILTIMTIMNLNDLLWDVVSHGLFLQKVEQMEHVEQGRCLLLESRSTCVPRVPAGEPLCDVFTSSTRAPREKRQARSAARPAPSTRRVLVVWTRAADGYCPLRPSLRTQRPVHRAACLTLNDVRPNPRPMGGWGGGLSANPVTLLTTGASGRERPFQTLWSLTAIAITTENFYQPEAPGATHV